MENKGQISDGYHTFDELYEHRHRLFLCLLATYTGASWASRTHSDGSSYEGWFVCGMILKEGQVSYHLPERLWPEVEKLGITENPQPEYDGHTAEDVVERLAGFFGRMADFKKMMRENPADFGRVAVRNAGP